MFSKLFALGFLGLATLLPPLLAAVIAVPTENLSKRNGTPSETGTNNGCYYSFYTDGGGDVVYTNEAGGEYNVVWTDSGDFVAGKGWNPGSAQ